MSISMNQSTHQPGARASRRRPAAVAAIVLGSIAATAVAGGALLVGVDHGKRDASGFYATGQTTLATPTHALVSDEIDLGNSGPSWLFRKSRLGVVRIVATGTRDRPVFIGVGRTSQVRAYLRGVSQDRITDFDVDPFSVTHHARPGTSTPAAPTTQTFWSSHVSGSGRQTVRWPVQEGNWSVAIMNADGSAGIRTSVSVGAKTRLLLWVGIGSLTLGGLLAAGSAACFVAWRRRAPGRPAIDRAGPAASPVLP
jgi:hypothetical protein